MAFEILTASSLEKVFSAEEPRQLQSGGSMLLNETYHFQLCIRSEQMYNICRVCIDGLPDCATAQVRRVVELPAHMPQKPLHARDDYLLKQEAESVTLYPELLQEIPPSGTIIRPNFWESFWITVKDFPAGTFELGLRVIDGKDETLGACSYTLKAINARLPEQELKYTAWVHYDSIAEQHGCKPFGARFKRMTARYIEAAVSHGVNMLYTPLFTPPLDTAVGAERMTIQLVDVSMTENGYEFDFSKLKEFMVSVRQMGIRYFEMSHLATQWGAKSCPKVVASVDGKLKKIFGWHTSSQSIEYHKFLDVFLPSLDGFLKENGFNEISYFHISDEPNEEHLSGILPLRNLIKKHMPGARIMEAISSYEIYRRGAVDIPVIATSSASEFAKEGALDWVYYCSGQSDKYLSNRFFNMPSQRNRVLGIQLYLSKAKGFLHWGFNFYRSYLSLEKINPYLRTDAGGMFESGDSFVVYPDGERVLHSLRHEVFYDGLQDMRALHFLESLIGRNAVEKLLKDEGVEGFTIYPHEENWLWAFRQKINDLIANNLSAAI